MKINGKEYEVRGKFCGQAIAFESHEKLKSYFTLRPPLSATDEIFNTKLCESADAEQTLKLIKDYWGGPFRVHLVEILTPDPVKRDVELLRTAYNNICDCPRHAVEDVLLNIYLTAIDDALNGRPGAKKNLRELRKEAEAEAGRKIKENE